MNNPVILVTAKSLSTRLPGKNMLPMGDRPLSAWSLQHAKDSGLPTVLSTDIQELAGLANSFGATVVYQDPTLDDHEAVINDALHSSNFTDRHCVLLQPTSPFRHRDILQQCLAASEANPDATVLTVRPQHCFDAATGTNRGEVELWDGCVVIYPPGKVCDYTNVVTVRNYFENSLQIDTEADYTDACVLMSSTCALPQLYKPAAVAAITDKLIALGLANGPVSLVVRDGGFEIPQDSPVVAVNHCHGWDGRRLDAMFLISNRQLKFAGITDRMRAGVDAAGFVFIRDHGELAWLLENLPALQGKHLVIGETATPLTSAVKTGVVANELLRLAGCSILRIGFGSFQDRVKDMTFHHKAGFTTEVALLSLAGTDAPVGDYVNTYTPPTYDPPLDCNGTIIGGINHGMPCHHHTIWGHQHQHQHQHHIPVVDHHTAPYPGTLPEGYTGVPEAYDPHNLSHNPHQWFPPQIPHGYDGNPAAYDPHNLSHNPQP